MIRLGDAIVLAHTKLRTHRVRTAITITIAGILFGVILAGVIIAQGIFTSIDTFSKEGLNNRSILAIGRMSNPFNIYHHLEDADLIKEVESQHANIVARKTAAAKKYGISYNAATEDPSPISVDEKTGKKYIDSRDASNAAVMAVAKERVEKAYKPFDLKGYLAPYKSARVLDNNSRVQATGGDSLEFMQDGVEEALRKESEQINPADVMHPMLAIVNQSVVEPFINASVSFDPSKGEVPVVVPFSAAEKLLGLKKLPADASVQARYDRLNEVRNRIGEVTASFCYRNAASQYLLGEARQQQSDFEKNGDKKGYVTPSVTYKPVSETACGPIEVEKDSRTTLEKELAHKYEAYQKDIGTYIGDPVQYKITVRAVGVSKDMPMGDGMSSTVDVSGLVQSLLGSWLGYDQWVIPPALLKEVPEQYRPAALFNLAEKQSTTPIGASGISIEEYLVEFGDPAEARAAMKRGSTSDYGAGEISAYPFGSSALLMDEAKEWFGKIVLWALLIVGGIAAIILGSVIGRTVAEGRRESAVFRAIGARRSDIGSIYATYAVLLAIRVAMFALALGVIIALTVEVLFAAEATLGARFAYASVNTPSEFHFFGITTWYVPIILGVIIGVGLLAAVIPIARSARRNPIKDMRDDT